jgi:hypothetical protein
VKTWAKETVPSAFCEFHTLRAAREACRLQSRQAMVILDGNVLVMCVPTAVTDFAGYARVVGGFVRAALEAADHVVCVWDEPALVTRAKLDEQRRRDMQRRRHTPTMSSDLEESQAPQSDTYGQDVVERCNPHILMRCREARQRFYDALCKRVMAECVAASTFHGKTLTFDGIDDRGADRPFGEARAPGMFSSSDRVQFLLERSGEDSRVGEGDTKITDLEVEVQQLRNTGVFFQDVEVVLISTIDTDSIAIELMHQAAKNEAVRADREGLNDTDESARGLKSLLCFRELRKDSEASRAVYSCIDMELFELGVMRRVFGNRHVENAHLRPHACALLVAGWTLCGCDFLQLKGMRSDVVFTAVCDIAQRSTRSLNTMEYVFALNRHSDTETLLEARREVLTLLRRMVCRSVDALEKLPRMAQAANKAREFDDNDLAKAAWVVTYWTGFELRDLDQWGFGEPLSVAKRARVCSDSACVDPVCGAKTDGTRPVKRMAT